MDDLYYEIAMCAEQIAFWKFQAMWHRGKLVGHKVDTRDGYKALEREFEKFRHLENLERYPSAEPGRDPGGT